jgi:hypothetical protein
VHSLDLELSDEPLYLLASAHLQLGLLYQRQDKLQAAQQQHRSALQCFPRFVAALSALGQASDAPASAGTRPAQPSSSAKLSLLAVVIHMCASKLCHPGYAIIIM